MPGTTYSYRVIAYDAAGNVAPSGPVVVATPVTATGGGGPGAGGSGTGSGGDNPPPPPEPVDAKPPRVGILAPLAGRPVRRKLAVRAIAGDEVGVVRMDLIFDGVRRASVNRAKAAWVLIRPRLGRHVITVRAVDSAGKVGSRSIRVRVVR